ncbi:MAG: cytochrome c oxidase subunit 3 [Solirubrobacteraceae bacterium]
MASESEKLPLGLTVPPVPAGVELPAEPPEVGARALSVAARLLAGASTFFFLAFLFAYFYLRSINQDEWWKPTATLLKEQKEVHVSLAPNAGLGVAFIVCLVLSVALTIVSGRQMKQHSRTWLTPAIVGILLGMAAVAIQCVEFTVQHFGPTDGAYASVFCAWTGFYLIAVLGTMYWLETQVATELRARRSPAADEGDIKDPDRLIAPGLDAAVFYWTFLGAIGVVTYVTLYLL